jgi:hypothetical protein
MTIRLVKRRDQAVQPGEPAGREKPKDPAISAQKWVEEFKARKAAERARPIDLLNHTAA